MIFHLVVSQGGGLFTHTAQPEGDEADGMGAQGGGGTGVHRGPHVQDERYGDDRAGRRRRAR